MKIKQTVTAVLCLFLAAGSASSQPVGTAFTYQGRLVDGAGPANGTYDIQFKLFDAVTVGTQVGTTVTKAGVTVSAGLFTTSLDFGPAAFAGSKRWLEIGVKLPAAVSYTLLTPRQELTPSPNAVFSSTTGDPAVQRRTVAPSCPVGQYVQSLAADGTPTCVVASGGGVSGVTASAPLASSGGVAPNVSLAGIVGIANGGTGSATQNFVDLTTNQSVSGIKTFNGANVFTTTQTVSTGNAAAKGLIVKGAASQTANLLELQNSAGVVLSAFGPTGAFSGDGTFNGLTVDANTLFVNATNDRVGIGTAGPTAKLEVYGDAGDGSTKLRVSGNGSIPQVVVTDVLGGLDQKNRWIRSSAGSMTFGKLDDAFTVAPEHMRIDANGNVAIGTTAPAGNARLDVRGGAVNIGGAGKAVLVV